MPRELRAIIPGVRAALLAMTLAAGVLPSCDGTEPADTPATSTDAPPSERTTGEATTPEPRPSAPPERSTEPEPEPPKKDVLELAFVGDVVLGEYVFDDHRSFAGPRSPSLDPFTSVAAQLRADLLVGNLESPVMEQVPERSPLRFGRRFGGSAPAVDALARAGFHAMSVANNHANDLGRDGLEQTPGLLRARGIAPVGAARAEGSPFVVETLVRGGWRVALLSATTWLNHEPTPGDPAVPVMRARDMPEVLVPLVAQARDDHDLVVVLLHWGRERRDEPGFVQIQIAHALVEAGADLVVG
ncbi:MAG: CapA family protein, partial [Myxococcales bacterium]|nr:CapA family protein [Myxococcales bacterium]